jgi:hypothetical protein
MFSYSFSAYIFMIYNCILQLWDNTGKFQDWIYISDKYIVGGSVCDKCQLIHIVQVFSQLVRLSCLKLWCVYIMPVQQCPSAQNSAFVLHFLRNSGMITTGVFQLIEQLYKNYFSPSIFLKKQKTICTQKGCHLIGRNNKLLAHTCKLVQNNRRSTVQEITKRLQFLVFHVGPF